MTTTIGLDDYVRIVVANRTEMDLQLQASMDVLVERAGLHRDRGILVTRHSPRDFTLELHRDVPYGETMESDTR
jgi:hypothetical protein